MKKELKEYTILYQIFLICGNIIFFVFGSLIIAGFTQFVGEIDPLAYQDAVFISFTLGFLFGIEDAWEFARE